MPPFMNLPHLHLLMNHVPTVGTVVALGLVHPGDGAAQ